MRPVFLLAPLLTLILSQLFYAFLPYSRRNYPLILLLTGAGVGLGQLWQAGEIPSLHLGELNLAPAVIFALVLQPLAARLPPIHFR